MAIELTAEQQEVLDSFYPGQMMSIKGLTKSGKEILGDLMEMGLIEKVHYKSIKRTLYVRKRNPEEDPQVNMRNGDAGND